MYLTQYKRQRGSEWLENLNNKKKQDDFYEGREGIFMALLSKTSERKMLLSLLCCFTAEHIVCLVNLLVYDSQGNDRSHQTFEQRDFVIVF